VIVEFEFEYCEDKSIGIVEDWDGEEVTITSIFSNDGFGDPYEFGDDWDPYGFGEWDRNGDGGWGDGIRSLIDCIGVFKDTSSKLL